MGGMVMRLLAGAIMVCALGKSPALALDPGKREYKVAAAECIFRRLQCKKACNAVAGVVTDRTKPTADSWMCARGCEDNYFICRQAIDEDWRKGNELKLCDSMHYDCRKNCVQPPFDFAIPIGKRALNCLPVCDKGAESCKAGEGYWLDWSLERERFY